MPLVAPFANVTLMDFGGQVEKLPANDDDWAMFAVMVVVPGCSAVIVESGLVLVPAAMLATLELLAVKLSVPMEEPQAGTDDTPGGRPAVHA
jgi:hypothetical protein